MAFLMERIDGSNPELLPEVTGFEHGIVERGGSRPAVTRHGGATIMIPEIGCVAGPAALALEIASRQSNEVAVSCTDPNGFSWTVQASAHGDLKSFATV
jgi:hypothetical protein